MRMVERRLELRALRPNQVTWQFMSAELQMWPGKPHRPADNLESAMHVLTWRALKYLPHYFTSRPPAIAAYVHVLYDAVTSTVKLDATVFGHVSVNRLPESDWSEHDSAVADEWESEEAREQVATTSTSSPQHHVGRPLETHRGVLDIFHRCLGAEEWPPIEKLPDQVPAYLRIILKMIIPNLLTRSRACANHVGGQVRRGGVHGTARLSPDVDNR
ncbi:hypothetical protein BD413DRAFT_543975 [Trametes elegans]|nr:hypothetical protein BD413DRAFT_543975 [Trametes elegans]